MLSNIIISTDSTSDLSNELISKYDIKVIPLCVVAEEKSYKDGIEISQSQIFEYQKRTGKLFKTTATNVAEWSDFYDSMGENDGIINFTISSEMSSNFSNSNIAADDFENVYTIDSRNLSTGIGLLILTACELREKGKSAKEIYEAIINLRDNVESTFVIDTLEYLHKGGRCSSIAALGANLLKLKPCIEVVNGNMSVGKKYRGRIEDVILTYVKDRLSDIENIKTDKIFVTHTMTAENHFIVEKVINFIKDNYNFENIYETTAGCTVSVHCGPNTLGVLFVKNTKVSN